MRRDDENLPVLEAGWTTRWPYPWEYAHPAHPVARGLITREKHDQIAADVLNRMFVETSNVS